MKQTVAFIVFSLVLVTLGWFLHEANDKIAIQGWSVVSLTHPGPADRILAQDIRVYDRAVWLDLENVRWTDVGDTHSMDPLLMGSAHTLEVIPLSSTDIVIGDIIVFGHPKMIHRVVDLGTDESGWYGVTKGDNAPFKDTHRVRFQDISGVVVGILY